MPKRKDGDPGLADRSRGYPSFFSVVVVVGFPLTRPLERAADCEARGLGRRDEDDDDDKDAGSRLPTHLSALARSLLPWV